MKQRKTELAVIAVTVIFIAFSAGFFVGRGSSRVSVERYGDLSVVTEVTLPGTAEYAAGTDDQTPEPLPPDGLPVMPVDLPAPPETAEEPPVSVPPEPAPVPEPTPEPRYTADGRLRLNYATQQDLEALPGIGETLARRIIEYREENGAFRTVAALRNVSGIGDARFEQIRDLVTVE